MTNLHIDGSLLFGSPEIDSVAEWVPKVLAVGGLIITERDGELIVQAIPHYRPGIEPPELPPLPISPERAAHLFHESPKLWEKLDLVLADLDHANRHSHIRKHILVQIIEHDRTIGGLNVGGNWYVLRTWRRRGYPRPHPLTDHTLYTQRPAKRRTHPDHAQGYPPQPSGNQVGLQITLPKGDDR